MTGTPRFAGRVVLVTGAGSGIGAATAALFAREGAGVACCDLDPSAAETTVARVGGEGGDALALACDVRDPAAARASVAACVEHFGGLDVLVNSAGIGAFHHFEEIASEEWERILAVNLTGTFHMCQAALPALRERKGASIVSVSSLAGLRGQAYSAAYCASKAGVVSLTRSLAVEYAKRGVRVNCVCPSGVATPLLAQFQAPPDADPELIRRLALVQRLVPVEEVAGAIAHLASADAGSTSGVALPIDHATLAG